MIVMKFGGTSVKDAAAIDRACAIVERWAHRAPLVVVSALAGVTNSLLEAARLAGQGRRDESLAVFNRLRQQHLDLLQTLEPDLESLREALINIMERGELTPAMSDEVSSCGEILSSKVFASILSRQVSTVHVDARRCLITDDQFMRANPLADEMSKRVAEVLLPLIQPGSAVVVGGYVGSTISGQTTTLGRGGSDYSATLFGACLDAEEVQIWTDVEGMMTADPRVVDDPWAIKHISFAEASELAYFGAKVLHPVSLLPTMRKNIPVRVLNSARSERAGTLITREAPNGRNPIKSIACKRNINSVTLTSSGMLMAHGFLKGLFEVFEKHRTSVDVVTTSEISVSLTTDDSRTLDMIMTDLQALGNVQVERNLALVCMVGSNLNDTQGFLAQALGCLEQDTIIRMLSMSASRINVTFVLQEALADNVVRRLHAEFFKDFDPDIFERVQYSALAP